MSEEMKPSNCVDKNHGNRLHYCVDSLRDEVERLRSTVESLSGERDMAFRVAENHEKREKDAVRIGCANITRAEKAEAALAESRAECQEQARLNGMGGERELALRAEVARLQGFHESCAKLTERVEELISEVNESDANFTEADKENDALRAEVASLNASEKKWKDAYHTEAEAAILLRAEVERMGKVVEALEDERDDLKARLREHEGPIK